MLQQILRDMWVDPEILAELDETQKQTLFCKMREEQVRRWQVWDQKVSKAENDRPKILKSGKKQVQFMNGEDGEPWVWVMGEHPADKSIETILAEEARQRALAQAREEAHQLRRSVEKELTQLIDYQPLDSLEQKFELSPKSVDSIEDTLDIYCTVDELRKRIEELEPEVNLPEGMDEKLDEKTDFCRDNIRLALDNNTLRFNFIEGKRDVLQELGCREAGCEGGVGGVGGVGGESDAVSHRVAAWERRVAAARAGDILRGLRARRARAQRDAQLHARDSDLAWREQERKAKEVEAKMRELARQARAAHRRGASLDGAPPPPPPPQNAGKPPNREAVVEWFRSHELPRGVGLDDNKQPVSWFHGLITRSEAEQLLAGAPSGSFLVRVSERVWGYAVSLRRGARCQHYLVEVAPGAGYRLLGAGRLTHHSLADLVNYHKKNVMTESGGELLETPCVPAQKPAILSPPS